MDDEKKDYLALFGFFSGNNPISSRIQGFSEREKGWLIRQISEFIKNGESAIGVDFGDGKIHCPYTVLRLSEIAENDGIYGLSVALKFLFGCREPVDYQILQSLYFSLKRVREEAMKQMKGG